MLKRFNEYEPFSFQYITVNIIQSAPHSCPDSDKKGAELSHCVSAAGL